MSFERSDNVKSLLDDIARRTGVTFSESEKSKILSVADMARRVRVTAKWLSDEADAGRIPCLKAGNRLLFSPSAVETALAERAQTNLTDGVMSMSAQAKQLIQDLKTQFVKVQEVLTKTYLAEYEANRALHEANGLTVSQYVQRRRIEDGLEETSLAPVGQSNGSVGTTNPIEYFEQQRVAERCNDPRNQKFRDEYRQHLKIHDALGVTEDEFVMQSRIDEGLDPKPSLCAKLYQ